MFIATALIAVVVTAPDLTRAGYSPDEEYTIFAVRGIQASGLPLLPSGLLYDRGLGYSYAAWLASLVTGDPLSGGRAVSVVCGLLALAVLAREVARIATPVTAAAAVVLVATSLPFWVSATTARFYAPFLLGYLVCLTLLARPERSWRRLAMLALVAGLTRWTHELAFTLAGVPVLAGVLAAREARVDWARAALAVAVGLALSQLAIFAVHAAAPPSNGDVMVKRFFVWQVLNLLERPPLDLPRLLPVAAAAGVATTVALALVRLRHDGASALMLLIGGCASSLGQLGVGPFVALVALPVAPAAVRRRLVGTSLAVLAAGATFWLLALVAAGLGLGEAARRLGATGFTYPLDMFTALTEQSPWLTLLAMAGLLARGAGRGAPWTAPQRAVHVLWLGWVAWFGVIESGITIRYLLLPVTFLICAWTLDAAALVRALSPSWQRVGTATALALSAMVAVESWAGPRGAEDRAEVARPTLDPVLMKTHLEPDDFLVSHDELGCMLAAGRIDAWLVLDPFFEERFVVRRAGLPTGTYTGAPASPQLTPLLERAEREHGRLIVVDVLRDVPGFGPTDALLPRQLARERLHGEVIADMLGLRLVQVRRSDDGAVASGARTVPTLALDPHAVAN